MTPTSNLGSNGGGSQPPDKRRAADHRPTLADEVEHALPTPTAADAHSSGGSSPADVTLTDALVRTDLGRSDNPRHLPTPRASDPANESSHSSDGFRPQLGEVVRDLPTPTAADGDRDTGRYVRGNPTLVGAVQPEKWGEYAAAVARHELVFDRAAPDPTVPGRNGKRRLSPRFVEWMMMLPEGHVTDVPGLTLRDKLHLLGNGVVIPQAAAAVRHLLDTWGDDG